MADMAREQAEWEPDYSPFHIQCKYCSKEELAWIRTEGRWKLHDKHGSIHDCRSQLYSQKPQKKMTKIMPLFAVIGVVQELLADGHSQARIKLTLDLVSASLEEGLVSDSVRVSSAKTQTRAEGAELSKELQGSNVQKETKKKAGKKPKSFRTPRYSKPRRKGYKRLSPGQRGIQIKEALTQFGTLSTEELARIIGVGANHISRITERMEKAGDVGHHQFSNPGHGGKRNMYFLKRPYVPVQEELSV